LLIVLPKHSFQGAYLRDLVICRWPNSDPLREVDLTKRGQPLTNDCALEKLSAEIRQERVPAAISSLLKISAQPLTKVLEFITYREKY